MNPMLMWTPALVVFALLLWLLFSRRSRARASEAQFNPTLEPSQTAHYRYFPQIRQALSACDEQYLREKASPEVARKTLRERRAVARQFLAALLEDFSNLERLARTVAVLSPEISREQEFERLMLGAKFRVLYAAVWVRLSVGTIPLRNIEHLAGLVGRLSTRMAEAMASVNALSQPGHYTA
jgi:hypothetical protein